MKKNLTELVFIIDRSGSMSGLEEDTISGFNAMIKKQKKEKGLANITTVLFDDSYEVLHDRVEIDSVNPITEDEYYVRGCTALLDAIGKTINKVGKTQKYLKDEERAEKVLVVITTDGFENASKEFTLEKVRKMIQNQKERYSWEFIFLGANIDAIATAESFGIGEDRAVNFNCDSEGTMLNYKVISETISDFRTERAISRGWKNKIDEDYKKRSSRR